MADDAIVCCTTHTNKTLVDGTFAVVLHFEPRDRKAASEHFGEPGLACGLVRLRLPPKPATSLYGEVARVLKLSDFFRRPEVWAAIGSDAEYLAWVRQQPCAFCGSPPPNEAAHVRRVANGAGTGIKPEYSAIALCRAHHEAQHQHGENAVRGKAQVDKWRIEFIQHWAWESLKKTLGYESWADIPPGVMREWAERSGVGHFVPSGYA